MKKPSRQDIVKWYNQKHKKYSFDAWRHEEAYPVFLDYLGVKQGKTLLDVGCGVGALLKIATKKGLKTYGVDVSTEAVKLSKKNSPKSTIKVGIGEKIPFKDLTFDYLTCLGVLEHFLDIKKGLEEFHRVGKNNATYCIMVPNSQFLYWKLTGSAGTEQQDINENLFAKEQWEKLFIEADFKIEHVYKDTWHSDKIDLFSDLNPLKIAKRCLTKIAWIIIPVAYTYQFIFILSKK